MDLIRPDGSRIHYVRTSPGAYYQTVIFEHTASATRFYKSRITWNGKSGWDLTLKDGLGSTLALTDNAGAVQTEYTYEPFGETTVSGAASANAFQYTGRENDGTGLYYYRARNRLMHDGLA